MTQHTTLRLAFWAVLVVFLVWDWGNSKPVDLRLEPPLIAAGSGQHAARFTTALPGLNWTPSDASAEARASIEAWRMKAGTRV